MTPQRRICSFSPALHVAGIVSDITAGGRLPDDTERHAGTDTLFARTARAAEMGARLAVWNEAATYVTKDEEPALLERAAALARERSVEIALAYAVMLVREPLRYENKYVWLRADGSTAETYLKHFPVPGEPSVRGTSPLRLAGSAPGELLRRNLRGYRQTGHLQAQKYHRQELRQEGGPRQAAAE
jgi:apolipoprotein N-acyltransferase